MKKLVMLTLGVALLGGSVAQAQPYDPGRGPPPVARQDMGPGMSDRDHGYRGDRGDAWRRHHHPRRICFWRHHRRICHWRHGW